MSEQPEQHSEQEQNPIAPEPEKEKTDDYRAFVSAAKETGLSREERKAVGKNPAEILEGTSEVVKEYIDPQAIESFFSALQGKKTNGDKLVGIGNFLYKFRPESGPDRVHLNELNKKDLLLIDLACKLIENAFYDGKLFTNFKEGETAPLAFTINVLAKVLDRRDSSTYLKGFDNKKAQKFLSSVKQFEENSIFPGVSDKKKNAGESAEQSPGEVAAENAEKEVNELFAKAEKIIEETDWDKYFKTITKDLVDAPHALEQAGIPGYGTKNPPQLEKLIADLSNWQTIIADIKNRSKIIKQQIQKGEPIMGEPFPIELYDADKAHDVYGKKIVGKLYGPYVHPDLSLKRIRQEATEKYESSKIDNDREYQSFGELMRSRGIKKLPDIIRSLDMITGEAQGPFGELIGCYRKAIMIHNAKINKIKYNDAFVKGEKRLLEQMRKNRSTVAYLIKSYLIADDMIIETSEDHRAQEEAQLMLGISYRRQTDEYGQVKPNSYIHEFVGHGKAFAQLHYIPEDMPIAAWARKYFQSLKKKKT